MLWPYSMRQSCHLVILPVTSAKLRIHLRAWCLVQAVHLVLSMYGCRSKISQTTRRYSRWVLSKFHSQSFKILDQYPIGLSKLPSYFCSSMHPIALSHSSVFRMWCATFLSKTSMGGEMSFFCKFRGVLRSSSLSCSDFLNCDLRIHPANGNAM